MKVYYSLGLSNGRCPGCDYIAANSSYVSELCSCECNKIVLKVLVGNDYIHIGVGSDVVCSTVIGNARASVRGMDNRTIPRFLCPASKMMRHIMLDMNTLPNVNTRRGGNNSSHAGLVSNVSPEVQGLPTGVSVKYAQDSNKQWFVLRATYNRESKAYDFITKDKTEAFLPTHYVYKFIDGKKRRVIEPLLPQLIFVYCTQDKVENYVKNTPELSFLNYYYNHFKTENNGNNPPLTISHHEMVKFINITSIDDEHIMLVESQQCHYKSGDKVQIVKGKFAGVKGRVARIAGQQRVVVEIEGLCLIATAYIPSAFIKTIP